MRRETLTARIHWLEEPEMLPAKNHKGGNYGRNKDCDGIILDRSLDVGKREGQQSPVNPEKEEYRFQPDPLGQ